MPEMCQEFWPCSAVPPEYVWLMPIIMPLLGIVVLGVPVARILHRAGRQPLVDADCVNSAAQLIAFWIFALSRWPTVERASA
jgi:hypothetical protein